MVSLLALAASVAVGSFVGYFAHRAMHEDWTGPLYKGHMEHHLVQYPPGKLTSETYLKPVWYHSGIILFAPAALAVFGVAGVLAWLVGLSLDTYLTFVGGVVAFGLLNDYVHDSFHLEKHWLQYVPGYTRLRELHFHHHDDMSKNYGIVTLLWDAVFKTKSE